jgi:nicotinamidase/pyrazinamidase
LLPDADALVNALIVIDVQNDFCPGGALAVRDGDAVVEPLNRLAREVPLVIATRDWHPPDHGSFAEQGGPWPVHCVRDTKGAELHPGIERGSIDLLLDKGQTPDRDGYSGFEGTDLERLLRERGVDAVHIGGLALDYCVRATALDARRAHFDVSLHLAATRAVEVHSGDGERAIMELREAGVRIVGPPTGARTD